MSSPAGARRVPKWLRVQRDVRRRLAEGAFGGVLPGEHDLAEEYGVSRHTVREALRDLRSEGLITSGRGRPPTTGAERAIDQPLGAIYSLFASVEAAGLEQRSIVRELDVRADAHVATRLGLEESSPFVYLERLRLADDEPLAHDRVWLPATFARPLLDADFGHTALYDELATRCGVRLTGGEERLRAVVPSAFQRRLLELDEDVAAFAIDRLGRVGERAVEWRTTLIRGDRFSALARFDAGGYRFDLARTDG